MGARNSLGMLRQDVSYALRMMRRSPGFTAVAIFSLALGIGANTAIFSLINTLMLRMLPVREPEQLVELLSRYPSEPRGNGFAWKFYEHFRHQNHVFSDLTGMSPARFQVSTQGLDSEIVDGEYVVGNFFPALGVKPAIGRLIVPEDDLAGTVAAVLSWRYWRNRFHLNPGVLGKRIVVNGAPATVVGVTSPEFSGLGAGSSPDLWVSLGGGRPALGLIARLRPGISIEQARAEMNVLDQWRVEELSKTSKDPLMRQLKLEVEPAGAGLSWLRDRFGKPLLVLMAVVGLLLFIACTNLASMLLARAAARQREMAVRISLGAGRFRLARQVLTESVLLSSVGALGGIFLAYWGADLLVQILASGRQPPGWPRRLEIEIAPDWHVLLFTVGVALLTGVLFGLAPAWHAFASSPVASLREIGRAGETRPRRLLGKSLVIAQVALSVVLLSAAGMFVRHLSNLRNVDLGFQRESVLLMTLDPARSGYPRAQLSRLYQELLSRLEAVLGVRSATLAAVTPISGAAAARFANVEGFLEEPGKRRYLALNWVAPKYFETLGTPLLAGRDFQFQDVARPRVAIVNQSMARYYFPNSSPLGKHVILDGEDSPYEIIGIVGDAKYSELREPAPRTIYLHAFQEGRVFSQFALRTGVAPAAVVNDVRRAVRDVLKTVPVAKVTTLAEQVDASIVLERLVAMLSGLFGALGALLAALGLYGLLAYAVARRTNEIGVRIALGAMPRNVTRMVLQNALGMVCAGLAVGAPIAFWSRRFAASWIQGLPVESGLPISFAAAAMIAVALVAAYVPARRAARVDPMEALRYE